tara:strand:- start:227 stop:1291 length:1065 start_codon:yes stop_codon:yes gene_type:complete
MKENILISTGGSGGHVVPAKVLSDHLCKKNNTIISTDKRGLKFLDSKIYNCEIINTPRLSNFFLLPFNIILIIYLTFKSLILLKKKQIIKIFSIGGYMSLPIILAAKILKINFYLIEPNQVLGRANKFFLNSCKKIFCYTEFVKNFPESLKNKMIIIKPLIREDIYKLISNPDIKKPFTLLIVGGSQGASIFDNNLKKSIVNISKKINIRIIQQTSQKNISLIKEFYNKNNIQNTIFSFEKNLADFMCQSDLCITRAGASTLAELSILNVPFIAVPLPTSKDNHQFENAKFYKDNDCCWIINQKYFDEKIEQLLIKIFEEKSDYFTKRENLKKLNYQNSWIHANQKILNEINEN